MKKFFYSFILGCLANCLAYADQATKPNVVLILVDDLGWQDVGSYDIDEPTPMETPNLDALAKKGVLFRQGYSPAPTCAPVQ
jgi:arylsulfatase A-like enzyme